MGREVTTVRPPGSSQSRNRCSQSKTSCLKGIPRRPDALFAAKLEEDRCERRQAQVDRIGVAEPGDWLSRNAAEVTGVAAAEGGGIGVQQFAVKTRLGHTHTIVLAHDRGEVGNYHQEIFGVSGAAEERKHARVGIVAVQPLEAVPVEIHLMQGRLSGIELVQGRYQLLEPAVRLEFEEVPFEAGVVVPFGSLAELAAHKDQLLAGMTVEVAVEQAQVGKLLPHVARHLVQQRALAVHHLVMRKRSLLHKMPGDMWQQ